MIPVLGSMYIVKQFLSKVGFKMLDIQTDPGVAMAAAKAQPKAILPLYAARQNRAVWPRVMFMCFDWEGSL